MRSASHTRRGWALAAGVLCAAMACAPRAAAQQPEVAAPAGGEDPAAALVQKVTEDLAAVDKALQDTVDATAAAETLDAARRSHLQAIRDIEELLKQVKYTKSRQRKPSGGGQGDSGGGGVGGKPPPRETDASGAPTPQPDQGGSKPEGADAGKPEAAGQDKPQDGAAGAQPPGQDAAQQPPPADPLGRFQRSDTDARWGLLPPKLQERLMNLHVDDVPERYRTWLESYIHALNRLEQQGGGAPR